MSNDGIIDLGAHLEQEPEINPIDARLEEMGGLLSLHMTWFSDGHVSYEIHHNHTKYGDSVPATVVLGLIDHVTTQMREDFHAAWKRQQQEEADEAQTTNE